MVSILCYLVKHRALNTPVVLTQISKAVPETSVLQRGASPLERTH